MIEDTRCKRLNERARHRGRYVLYWMQQAQRASFNPALEYAIAWIFGVHDRPWPERPVFGRCAT